MLPLQSYQLQEIHPSTHRYATVVSLVYIYVWVHYLIYVVSSCISMHKDANMHKYV